MNNHIQLISWTSSTAEGRQVKGTLGFVKDEKTARKVVKKLSDKYSVDKGVVYYYHQLAELCEENL